MKRLSILLLALISTWPLFSQNKIEMYLKADSLLSSDKPEAAEEYLIQLSRDNPHNEGYHYSLGEIYYNKGDFRNSIVHLKKAQEFGLEYRSNYFLACNYIGINKPDSALYYLTKHVVSPMNGNFFCEEPLYDTIFQELHNLPGYIKLLPPEIIDSLNVKGNWIKDIEYLSLMLKKTHYDPFCKLNESDWDNAIEELKQDVPSLNNYQILVRLHQFVAMIGDGHTSVYMQKSILPEKTLPILTQVFSDGCYIVGATDGYKELLGAKIITVNGLDFESVYDRVNSVISVDNEMGFKYLFAWSFMRMNLVHGLGLSQSRDSLEITYLLDNVEGKKTIQSVKKLSGFARYHAHYEKKYPLFLENYHRGNRKSYWYKYIKDENILYVQINGIRSLEDNPLPVFCDSINLLIDSLNISAFVLDIRNNGGGNTDLNKHILKVMLSDKINIKGKSFTVIGCNTFSAAQNLTNIIENYTETIFIGERTASKPRFNGETNPFTLPYSGLMVGSSNVFHQHGYSTDTRKWVAPDILVEFNFEHFKNGIDPVIEEIIKFTSPWLHAQESSQAISSDKAQKQYYAIEINNVLCGFSEEAITSVKKDGKEFIQIVSKATILQTVLGGDADIKVESEKLIDAQTGNFVRMVSIINQGDVQFGAILNVDGLSVNHKNKLTGESKIIPITEDVILDNGSFYTFLISGINNNSLDKEYRVLETMRGEIETRSYKMIGREIITLNGIGYNSIKFNELYKGTGASGELWIEEGTGYVLKRVFPMGRKIYLTDSSVTKKIQAAKMDDITFAKVDKVISDVSNISYLKVKAKIRSTGEWITPESLNYKGQAFTGTVIDNLINGIFEISQEHYKGTTAPAFPFDYSNNEDLKKYLEPDDFIESDDPVLISKAKEITHGAENSWEAARLLSNWVASNISYAIPGGISARKTFDTRSGECGAHSRLLAAFCRGVGIPAKFVIGCMYSNTYGGTFGQHAWNEIYMGHVGWIPVDATAFEIDYIDSGHIRLGERTSFNPVEMEILEYETSTAENEELVVPEEYQKYIGKYTGPQSGKAFEVLYSDGGLAVDIPDQIQIALNHPDENGMWYAKITKQLCFSFEFDSLGQSKNMHLHELTPLPKTSSPDSIDAAVPDEFRPYLGQYYFGAIQDKLTIIYSDGTLSIKGLTVEKAIRLQAPDKDGKWMDEFNHNGIIFKFSDEGKINRLVICTEFVLPRE